MGLADGSLVAVTNAASLTNAAVKWRYRAGAAMVGSPAMDLDGVIYLGSKDNRLHAVANGRVKWTFNAKSDITTSPMITPDGDIVVVAGGAVFSVSPDGAENFVFRAGSAVNTVPVVSEDGVVYFGSNKEFIYAVDGGSSGGDTNGTASNTNGIVWKVPAGANVRSSPALGFGGNLYIGTDNRRVLCIDTNGGVAWRFPATGRTRGPVRGSVSIGADGTIYVGTEVHTLYAIFPDGAPKWFCDEFKGQVRSSPVIDSFGIVYFSAGKSVYAVEDDAVADEAPWPQFRRDAQHSATSTQAEPVISVQPTSVTTNSGATVQFTVVAHSPVPFTYQWLLNGSDIDPETNPTATNATLVLTNVTPLNAGIYEVVLSGDDFDDVFSEPAELIVTGPPFIVSGLTNRFALAGNDIRLEVNAISDRPLTYTWITNDAIVTNTSDPFLVLTNAQVGSNQVRVLISNGVEPILNGPIDVIVFPNTLTLSTNNFIAAGNRFSAAVVSNQLFTWGADLNGQLGDGATNNRNIPTRTSTDVNWLSVSAGGRGNSNASGHALAIRTDGSLYGWGANSFGQLGLNNTNDQRLPVRIGIETNWIQVEAGANHSVALRRDGTIWTWGGNQYGQLGSGDTNRLAVPTQMGADSAWIEVRAGGFFTLARRADGTIWGWGRNESSQLGNNSTNDALAPVQIGTAHWNTISAGVAHSLGIQTNGTLWVWGHRFGMSSITAGNLTNAFRVPTQVGSATNWTAVDAGADHSLAINDAGSMFAFGANNIGQLGNGSSGATIGNTNNANIETPTQIGAGRAWSAIDAGVKHSLARATDGTIWAWGWNNFGQVGDGTGGDGSEVFNRKTPVQLTFNNFANPNTNVNIGPPVITQQPASTNVAPGGTATFTVQVTGATPMDFRWYFTPTNGASTNLIPTAATNTYQIPLVVEGNAGTYLVVITNIEGAVTSALATLTVTNSTGSTNDGGITPPGFPAPPATISSSLASAPVLVATRPGTNGIVIPVLNSSANQVLVLEFKNHLSDSNWTAIVTNRGSDSLTNFIDPAAPAGSRFYRVRVE
jgi:alpha-tubulin suppressor-like RCC1 family protein